MLCFGGGVCGGARGFGLSVRFRRGDGGLRGDCDGVGDGE